MRKVLLLVFLVFVLASTAHAMRMVDANAVSVTLEEGSKTTLQAFLSGVNGSFNTNFAMVSNDVRVLKGVVETNAAMDDFNSDVGNVNFMITSNILYTALGITNGIDYQMFTTNAYAITTNLTSGISNVYTTISVGDANTFILSRDYTDVAVGLNSNFTTVSQIFEIVEAVVYSNAYLDDFNSVVGNDNFDATRSYLEGMFPGSTITYREMVTNATSVTTSLWAGVTNVYNVIDFGDSITLASANVYAFDEAERAIATNFWAISNAIDNIVFPANTNAAIISSNAATANYNENEISNAVSAALNSVYRSFTNFPDFAGGSTNFGWDYKWLPEDTNVVYATNTYSPTPVDFGYLIREYVDNEARSIAVAVVNSNVLYTDVLIPINAPFVASNILAQVGAFYADQAAIINGNVTLQFTNSITSVTSQVPIDLSSTLQSLSFGGNTITFDFSRVELVFNGGITNYDHAVKIDAYGFNDSRCIIENLDVVVTAAGNTFTGYCADFSNIDELTLFSTSLAGTGVGTTFPYNGMTVFNVNELYIKGGFLADVVNRGVTLDKTDCFLESTLRCEIDYTQWRVAIYLSTSSLYGGSGSSLYTVNKTAPIPSLNMRGVYLDRFSSMTVPYVYGENLRTILLTVKSSRAEASIVDLGGCVTAVEVGAGSYFFYGGGSMITNCDPYSVISTGGIVENAPTETHWWESIPTDWHTVKSSEERTPVEYSDSYYPNSLYIFEDFEYVASFGSAELAICEYRIVINSIHVDGSTLGDPRTAGAYVWFNADYGGDTSRRTEYHWTYDQSLRSWSLTLDGPSYFILESPAVGESGDTVSSRIKLSFRQLSPEQYGNEMYFLNPFYTYHIQRRRTSTP